MINIDQALTWVTWAVFSGWSLGALCGASLVFAAWSRDRDIKPEKRGGEP